MSVARSEVLVESAYFTVMDDMLARLAPYLESSISIKALTNSLATTDVWTIHAGYTRDLRWHGKTPAVTPRLLITNRKPAP
ncbi:MAG: hypothetical protein V7696_18495 [Halioglobus sp.]